MFDNDSLLDGLNRTRVNLGRYNNCYIINRIVTFDVRESNITDAKNSYQCAEEGFEIPKHTLIRAY